MPVVALVGVYSSAVLSASHSKPEVVPVHAAFGFCVAVPLLPATHCCVDVLELGRPGNRRDGEGSVVCGSAVARNHHRLTGVKAVRRTVVMVTVPAEKAAVVIV